MPVRVKICGITRIEDALFAERLGAFAVGFVFYPRSGRNIGPADAGRIARALGPEIMKVGVFVDEDAPRVRDIVAEAGLTAVQFHGGETPEYVRKFDDLTVSRRSGWRRVRAWMHARLSGRFVSPRHHDAGAYGGTGKTFDWGIAGACRGYGGIIVAGGLTPFNVGGAIRMTDPWGVDVSGGVELSPGIKDHAAMNAFFDAVRSVARE